MTISPHYPDFSKRQPHRLVDQMGKTLSSLFVDSTKSNRFPETQGFLIPSLEITLGIGDGLVLEITKTWCMHHLGVQLRNSFKHSRAVSEILSRAILDKT